MDDTGDNIDGSIGALIRRYESNLKTIAGLTADLQHIGAELESLGNGLLTWPATVQSDNAQATLDASARIVNKLQGLRAAIDSKIRMDACLRQAGLDRLIDNTVAKRST